MVAENRKMNGCVYLVKYFLPVVILLIFIFWMSGEYFTCGRTATFFVPIITFLFPSLSLPGIGLVNELIRASAHVLEFFLLGLLLSFAVFRIPLSLSRFKKIVLIMALLFAFALGDEFRQSMVALREASIMDVGLDMAGGLVGLLVAGIWAEQLLVAGG